MQVVSCVVLGFGVYVLASGKDVLDLVLTGSDDGVSVSIYSSAAILIIVISTFIIIVTFFGCCGALKENKCMLGTYFAIILAMFIILVIAAVIGYTQTIEELEKPLKKSIAKYDPSKDDKTSKAVTKAWDNLQTDVSFIRIPLYSVSWNKGYYNNLFSK